MVTNQRTLSIDLRDAVSDAATTGGPPSRRADAGRFVIPSSCCAAQASSTVRAHVGYRWTSSRGASHSRHGALIATLLVAAATLVPSVAAQAQAVDDSTPTTYQRPPPSVVHDDDRPRPRPPTTTAPPVTEAPTTAPPAPRHRRRRPGDRAARHGTTGDGAAGTVAEYLGPLPLGGCAITTVVQLNTRSRDVICVERVLAGLGYSFEGPDELFSVHSVNSLKAWQRGQGIRADGIVGAATGARLGIWGTATPPAGGGGAGRVRARTSDRSPSAAAPSRPRSASTRPAPT